MEYGNGLCVKRDETTIKSVEALYHYINTLPLTKHQRGKAVCVLLKIEQTFAILYVR